jgi:hypothetical protein
MGKLLVGFGALLGVLGLFLPIVQVNPRHGYAVRSYSLHAWSDTNVWDVGDEVGAYALLTAWLLVEFIALQAIATWYSRRQALLTLLISLPPAALAVYWVVKVLTTPPRIDTRAGLGVGLILLTVAGVLSVLGSCVGAARPERSEHG